MKIILAIVQDKDSNRLANEFIDANIRATKIILNRWILKKRETAHLLLGLMMNVSTKH